MGTEGQKEDGDDGTFVLPCCTFNEEEDDEVEKVSPAVARAVADAKSLATTVGFPRNWEAHKRGDNRSWIIKAPNTFNPVDGKKSWTSKGAAFAALKAAGVELPHVTAAKSLATTEGYPKEWEAYKRDHNWTIKAPDTFKSVDGKNSWRSKSAAFLALNAAGIELPHVRAFRSLAKTDNEMSAAEAKSLATTEGYPMDWEAYKHGMCRARIIHK